MGQTSFNNQILKWWFNIYIIINVLYIIYLWVNTLIVRQHSANLSLETSLCTIMCITNIIGVVYLSRNLRFGIYLLLGTPIVILLSQIFLIKEVSIAVYFSISLSIITRLLLCIKSNNRTFWSQMKKGVDIIHFKHIYQLSTILIVIVVCYGTYSYITKKDSIPIKYIEKENLLNGRSKEELLQKLNKANITLNEISEIEKLVTEIPYEYEARIMALRHILAAHIVSNIHDIKAFRSAYFLRKNAMSKEQQEVLDWFFRQSNEVFEIWETFGGCDNLVTFQKSIKEIIEKRNITEF